MLAFLQFYGLDLCATSPAQQVCVISLVFVFGGTLLLEAVLERERQSYDQ